MSVLIHPSSLSKIMSDPKEKGEILSKGAKTYLTGLAAQHVYGFKPSFWSKETAKGLQVENQSIELYNHVFFTNYTKNTERKQNEFLTGESDIVGEDCILDIKSSWSLATFPATKAMAHDPDYEYQLRAYMMLWDKPFAELVFCMVSTPEDLLKYEDPTLHLVDHIPAEMRITVVQYKRDMDIEAKIVTKCKAAQEFVERTIETIRIEHQYN